MKLLFVGDVMLGRLVNEALKTKLPEYVWGDTLPIFQDANLRICNLECVISNWGEPMNPEKTFHFRTDAKNVAVLNAAGINLVSLANNHSLDFGEAALTDTLKLLNQAGISHTGAGRDIEEAQRATILPVNNVTIGFLAVSDNEPGWEATEKSAGIYYVPININDRRAKNLFEFVKKSKEQVDLLLVSTHWGPNWDYRPPKEHPLFARKLIDCGADIIFGHSAHVFRGVEIYRGCPILYSCGDFIDDYAVDEVEKNDESFIFVVKIEGSQIVSLDLFPTVIRESQAQRATGDEAEHIAMKMQLLCKEIQTTARWQQPGYLSITFS